MDPKGEHQFRAARAAMLAAVQVAQAVEAFNGHGEDGQEPADQQAVGLVMADMLEAMTAFGFIEAPILDLPTTLRHAVERLRPDLRRPKIRQPVGFHHLAIRFVLTIEEDPHRRQRTGARSNDANREETRC